MKIITQGRCQRQRTAGADDGEAERLAREVERWRRPFVLGEIDEGRYRREASPLRRRLAELQRPQEVLDVERAVNCLRDMGSLWAGSPRQQQRQFVREVFERMVVEGPELASITPKPLYSPLFVLDRRERFGGDFCSMAPRAGGKSELFCGSASSPPLTAASDLRAGKRSLRRERGPETP